MNKTLKKEIQEDTRKMEISHVCRLLDYCENGYMAKHNLQIQCNPHQNPNVILHRNRKINPTIHMEAQKTPNSQDNPEQKE
jgi:hypothetical protein